MDSEERDILNGLGLAAVALACAALTAVLVISFGSAVMRYVGDDTTKGASVAGVSLPVARDA